MVLHHGIKMKAEKGQKSHSWQNLLTKREKMSYLIRAQKVYQTQHVVNVGQISGVSDNQTVSGAELCTTQDPGSILKAALQLHF